MNVCVLRSPRFTFLVPFVVVVVVWFGLSWGIFLDCFARQTVDIFTFLADAHGGETPSGLAGSGKNGTYMKGPCKRYQSKEEREYN